MQAINTVIAYFDLLSHQRKEVFRGQAKGGGGQPASNLWILAHYLALWIGIVAKSFLEAYSTQSDFSLTWPHLVVASIVATSVFPAIYKKAMSDTAPNVVQLCVTFATGLGYKTLVDGVVV